MLEAEHLLSSEPFTTLEGIVRLSFLVFPLFSALYLKTILIASLLYIVTLFRLRESQRQDELRSFEITSEPLSEVLSLVAITTLK